MVRSKLGFLYKYISSATKPSTKPADHTHNATRRNPPTPSPGLNPDPALDQHPHPLDAPYLVFAGHGQVQFDMYLSPHPTRGHVLQFKGFPDFKSVTRKDMIDMVIATERTNRSIMDSPRFQQQASSFNLNRSMHQYGSAIRIHNDHLLLVSMGQDRVITFTYFYALGVRVSINDQIFSVWDFWRYLASNYMPPKTAITRPGLPAQQTARTFAKPNTDSLLDFQVLFSTENLDYVRNFDMDDIGRYKISTVKNIKTRDVHLYRGRS